jgi:hypothetical protein
VTMELPRNTARLRRAGLFILAMILSFGAQPSGGEAVSVFGVERESCEAPAAIDLDDLWFYEQDRSRQIPEINPKWIAAAFGESTLAPDPGSFEPERDLKARLLERAEEIVQEHEQIVDVYYDENLAEDGCFFSLRDGLGESEVKDLIRALQRRESIAYVHPTLILRGKTVAYFNAFQMNWKTGVDDVSRKALMEQVHVSVERPGEVYRVDVLAIPFFTAINLLAEDVRVLDVTPVFVTLAPTIRVDLSVPLGGCRMGDRIPFVFRVDFSDRIRIDPSSLVNINLRPGQIQKELFDLKFDPYDYVTAVSRSPFVLTGWMKIYSPGEFVIPAVEIKYECIHCSGERVRSIKTEAIPLKVASLIPSKLNSPKLVVPTDNVKPVLPVETLRRQERNALWQAIVCFVLAAALLGWSGRRWAAVRREREGEKVEKQEDALAERLRACLIQSPTGPHWVYAGDAGRLLREYLDAKYGLARDPRQASGAVFFKAVRERVPGRVASRLGPLLQEIDRMIALETAEYPELERWQHDTLELVDLAQSVDA